MVFRIGRTYERSSNPNSCNRLILAIFGAFVFFGIPIFLYSVTQTHYHLLAALTSIGPSIASYLPSQVHLLKEHVEVNVPVHLSSDDIQSTVKDHEFNIKVDEGLKLQRSTEFCQWHESIVSNCEKNRDGDETCWDTYVYHKSWSNYLINSLFFNQPGAHYNPQRNPFPSFSNYPESPVLLNSVVNIGPLLPHSVRAPTNTRNMYYNRDGQKPVPGFFERLATSYFHYQDHSRYEKMEQLENFRTSEAARDHGFLYMPGTGYFFSAYQKSDFEKAASWAMQYMEGSLFDWQPGDFFSICEAGDIRVQFQVSDPSSVSVFGQIVEKSDTMITMDQININGTNIGLVHEGIKHWEQMFEDEIKDSQNTVLFARLLCCAWGWFVCYVITSHFDIEFQPSHVFALSGPIASGVLYVGTDIVFSLSGTPVSVRWRHLLALVMVGLLLGYMKINVTKSRKLE